MKLRKNFEFLNVYRNGAYYADKYIVLYVLKNRKNETYFGITVGKKVGGSVVRSRVTRLIREAVRRNIKTIRPGYDIVVLARAGSGGEKLARIEKSFIQLSKKGRVYLQETGEETRNEKIDPLIDQRL